LADDDDEIAMERIQHRVVIGSVAPDHPEFGVDTPLQSKRCKEAVNGEGFLFLGFTKSGEDAFAGTSLTLRSSRRRFGVGRTSPRRDESGRVGNRRFLPLIQIYQA
jgi:hypothetical protein